MAEFFKTIMGRNFYEGAVPRIVSAIEKIAKLMEEEATNKSVNQRLDAMIEYFDGVDDLSYDSRLTAPHVDELLRHIKNGEPDRLAQADQIAAALSKCEGCCLDNLEDKKKVIQAILDEMGT